MVIFTNYGIPPVVVKLAKYMLISNNFYTKPIV